MPDTGNTLMGLAGDCMGVVICMRILLRNRIGCFRLCAGVALDLFCMNHVRYRQIPDGSCR